MADTSTLFTTVKNPTGSSRSYGYLQYHGKTLAAGAEFSQVGDLITSAGHGGVPTRKRYTDAIQRDLLNNKLEIIKTPSPILKDTVTGAIKAIKLTSGTLGVTDPSWGPYTD